MCKIFLNNYEYTKISNANLPDSWKSQRSLNELSDFLQQNWEQRSVFYEDNEISSKQQFIDFLGSGSIRTKKYIGTIVFRGEQLNIYPKVFSTNKNDHETNHLNIDHMVYNIVKWIEYCNKTIFPFVNISTDLNDSENLKELFISLYIGYVRTTIKRGLYYKYIEETKDCNSIKGKFDINDYLTSKITNGNYNLFKCTYSSFEFDNSVNRIIKYTCKQLINTTSKKNEKELRKIITALNEVSDIVCSPNDCDNIRLSKMNGNYSVIISMSKMFLMNKMSNYTIDTNDNFCFLFPTDLLFEGFIGGYLKEVVSNSGGKVYLQESKANLIEKIIYKGVSYGPAFNMRHDILVELHSKIFILDTKYKEITRFEENLKIKESINYEVNQGDLYQILEYARKRNVSDVFLLYPMYRFEEKETDFPIAVSESPLGNINIHFVRLPFVFEKENENLTKEQLSDVIKSILIL